jgi:hypothetical protein
MVRTFSVVAICAALAAALAAGVPAAKHKPFPEVIQLPPGFAPEGIEIKGSTFYVGSVASGAIFRGNLRTGDGATLIPGGFGRPATGVELQGHRLFVAGAGSGNAYVYDTRTKADRLRRADAAVRRRHPLEGKTLYVVQNRLNQVAVVRLDRTSPRAASWRR